MTREAYLIKAGTHTATITTSADRATITAVYDGIHAYTYHTTKEAYTAVMRTMRFLVRKDREDKCRTYPVWFTGI